MKKINVSEEQKRRFDEEAAKVLDKVLRIVNSRAHDADLAADIVQEAFLRFLRYMNGREWSLDIKSFDAFLTKIALNCLKSRWRAQWKRWLVSLDSDLDEKLHEEINQALGLNGGFTGADDNDTDREKLHVEVLLQLLDGFSEEEKHLLYLNRVEDLSPKKIAERLGMDVDVVRYQLTKIVARLRYRVKQYKQSSEASGKKGLF